MCQINTSTIVWEPLAKSKGSNMRGEQTLIIRDVIRASRIENA